MGIPLIQQIRVGSYILKQRILERSKYPLVLMLEPLFRCNLACAGCGKIDYPKEILDQRLSVDQCIEAVEECGAPIVSIPGGEPLIHKEMPIIVEELMLLRQWFRDADAGNASPSPPGWMEDWGPEDWELQELQGGRKTHKKKRCTKHISIMYYYCIFFLCNNFIAIEYFS